MLVKPQLEPPQLMRFLSCERSSLKSAGAVDVFSGHKRVCLAEEFREYRELTTNGDYGSTIQRKSAQVLYAQRRAYCVLDGPSLRKSDVGGGGEVGTQMGQTVLAD